MSEFKYAAVLFLGLGVASSARASSGDLTLTLSAGTGWQATSPSGRIPTNIMVAPGVKLLGEMLRLDVGLVADLPDVSDGEFDLQVRPSLVAELPILPIYGRVTAGVTHLLNGPVAIAFGPSVGVRGHVGELSVLGEIGYIPIVRDNNFESIFEARVGIGFGI